MDDAHAPLLGEDSPASPPPGDLRILILEDVSSDAQLMEMELREAGLRFTTRRAGGREEYEAALEEGAPSVILADYSVPGFEGVEALRIARERVPDVPFVFVSGVLGEERAVDLLKEGATDYVVKQRLSRLPVALRRALHEAEERRARERAEEAVRRSEETQRTLLEMTNAAVANRDRTSLWKASVRALEGAVPFDRASLVLHDPERDVLHLSSATGRLAKTGEMTPADPIDEEIPREGSHLDPVIRDGTPRVCRDLQEEARTGTEERLLAAGIRSYLSVPLVGQRGVLGALNVGSAEPDRYGDREVEFLRAAGHQMGLAVENMLAYREIEGLTERLEREKVYLQEEIETEHNFLEIVGESAPLQNVLRNVESVAATDTTVLITGETGTGKELVARGVHDLSARKHKPLVKVNCAALPAGLIETELFGHERGAFTGAESRRTGRFELADGGTIFLDEIGDLPLDLQSKLLRVLEHGEFERVGGSRTHRVDVRVIAATNRDLENAVGEGRFRDDLYYRLSVFPVEVPPLRERPEDIPLLVRRFVDRASARLGKTIETVPEALMRTLQGYSWPGNVRELQNVVERAVILSPGPELRLADRISDPRADASASRGFETLEEVQRRHIVEALEATGWVVSGEQGAARLLGVKPTTLESRMKKLGIRRPTPGARRAQTPDPRRTPSPGTFPSARDPRAE